MMPMLSVIIPVYNGEKYLNEAVQSVLAQPCGDWEIIIVDDGSKDSSGAIADALAAAHENICVCHIPNGGVSAARNVGISKASGRYIAFLDADDVLCRDAYDAGVHATLASEAYDVLSFSYLKGMDDLRWGRLMPVADGEFLRGDEAYIRQTSNCFCAYLYHSRLFADGLQFPVGIGYNEDRAFSSLATRSARRMKQYSKPWFIYRMNFGSAMHNLRSAECMLQGVAAWAWCKQHSRTEKDRSDCDGNVFSYMVEYMKMSCGYGKPAREIIRTVRENPFFAEAMEHYGTFWCHEQSADFYHTFMEKPGMLWLKYRCIGLARRMASQLIRTGLGRAADQKIRYRLRLDEYVPRQ